MGAGKTEKFNRHSAIKTSIKEILSGSYVQENEQAANYLLMRNGEKLFRVNLAAAVLHKETQGNITNTLIDDGSGKIILRSFEEDKIIRKLTVGDVVLVIGRIRVYNKEKYVSPEIIKKIDPLWLKVRSLERGGGLNDPVEDQQPEQEELQEDEVEEIKDDVLLPVQKLKKLITELDDGNGVPIEDVIENSPLDETEELLQKMMESGDIFQNSPGKIKVL